MTTYLTALELGKITGFPLWKAQRVIQAANKQIRKQGGITRKGSAPRKLLEALLGCDLSDKEEA